MTERADLTAMLPTLVQLSRTAGAEILQTYQSQTLQVEQKRDASPVTQADRAAHAIIVAGLTQAWPQLPVLSEEGEIPSFEQRRHWSRYWLVDPLDGTREFIAGNGEFTVNIALIEAGRAVLGVIYAPVSALCYTGVIGAGAFKAEFATFGVSQDFCPIHGRRLAQVLARQQPVEVLTSRRFATDAQQDFLARLAQKLPHINCRPLGSSLKACWLAEGQADLYARLGPTSEWDTAAAQAILEAAGGVLVDAQFRRLLYNQKPSLINPDFYALADSRFHWQDYLA